MSRMLQLLLAVFVLLPGVAAAQNEPLKVYAGIGPIQYLVDRVADSGVDARVLVGAGQRPETYEPTPRQIAALAGADVFFGVGMPLEAAWRRQLRAATGQRPEWIDLSRVVDEMDHDQGSHEAMAEDTGASGHEHHPGRDPHVWLNPRNARRMVSTISETLGRLRPASADRYTANAEKLNRELDALHGDIQSIFDQSPVDAFLVFHPAWGHFADAYGLEQLAIEKEGKEPGPRSFAEVIGKAKAAGIRTVFLEPQHDTRLAETVAGAIGASVDVLDPLAYDYISNLREAARAIAGSGS